MRFETAHPLRRLSGLFFVAVALALFVFPGRALAVTGYCMHCGGQTEGSYSYSGYYSVACYEPTCTQDGYGSFVCGTCGQANRPVAVPALGHNHQFSHSTATCTNAGEAVYVCTRCGDAYTQFAGALGHAYWQSGFAEPTCTTEGSRTLTCSRCGDTRTETLAALGHDYIHARTEPTCTQPGEETLTCSRCGDSTSTVITPLGHDAKVVETIEPTCTEAGTKVSVCQRCGIEVRTDVEALGHQWPDTWTVEVEPTSFDEGREYRVCARCGEREERIIARLPLTGTPGGIALIVGIVLAVGAAGFGIRKAVVAQSAAAAAAGAASAAQAAGTFDIIRTTRKKVLANLGDDPSNTEFLDLVAERPNIVLEVFDADATSSLSERVAEFKPDAVLLDFTGAAGFEEAMKLVGDLRAQHERVKFEAIAFDADEALLERLATEKEDGALFAFSEANENKYVKLSQLIVPLYKDMMTAADSADAVGAIANIFGMPSVGDLLNIAANATRAGKLAEKAKDAFSGSGMGLSDGATVANTIAELLGLGDIATLSELTETVADVHESEKQGREKGESHDGAPQETPASEAAPRDE